jgi:ABC-type Fe3+/spermidine/putrescine transport system ATPase subunit
MTQIALRVERITQIHVDRTILEEVTFAVKPKEYFAIVGPSGCGKSVLLRIIVGLERPASGRVFIGDQDVTDMPAEKHRIPMMFQSFALFPLMDVYNNVGYGPRRWGYSEEEVDKRVRWAVNLVRLGGFEKRKVQTLSGGQKQRVAFARSLALDASILVLDDPLAALDANLRVSMQTELKNIHREVGKTFLHVTSDQGEAIALADRIAVMNNGRLEQVGTASELLSSPATTFVAKFFGRNSILDGQLISFENNNWVIETPAGKILAKQGQQSFDIGTSVGVVVPVDRIIIQKEGENAMPGHNHLNGVISDIHFSSGVFTLWLSTACKRPVLVEIQNEEFNRKPFEKGNSVIINWLPEDCSVSIETLSK